MPYGKALRCLSDPTRRRVFEKLRAGLPGLVGHVELDNVGHWVQHEASGQVSDQLVKFLRTVNPA